MITTTVCFLSLETELFGLHHESLTPTQKFWISPRVSYTHSEILDISTGLLHPHRNSGYLHGSLTPTKKFWTKIFGYLHMSLTPTQKLWISPRVSYTHIEILDISTGLLHPHRTLRILPRVSFTHTGPFEYYRGSPSPTQDLSDITAGLLQPHRTFRIFPMVSFTKFPGFSP